MATFALARGLRSAFDQGDPPSIDRQVRYDLDTTECIRLFGDKRWHEIDRLELMKSTYCFSFLPSDWLVYYIPSYFYVLLEESENKRFVDVVDTVMGYMTPNTWLYEKFKETLTRDQVEVVIKWMVWISEQLEGVFKAEAEATISDLRSSESTLSL